LYNITNSVSQDSIATVLREKQKQQAERVVKMNKKIRERKNGSLEELR
jgi:hypothetical protein